MIRFIRLTVFVFSVVLSSFLIADPLVFGIVPQQSAKKLAATWSSMLAELSKRTGFQVIFSTAKDIPTFERRLAEGNMILLTRTHTILLSIMSLPPIRRLLDKKISVFKVFW